jgi:hypothetical protein
MNIRAACFYGFVFIAIAGCNTNKSSSESVTDSIPADTAASPEAGKIVPPSRYTMHATFEGASAGDYFHLLFKDEKGTTWDFGNGKNNLEPYTDLILLEPDAEGNAGNIEYSGMLFEVSWDSLENEYYCCDGEMNPITGRVPTIVSLKLLEMP